MVRCKREFKVVDARTGEDITHNVLTQIIMDQESSGKTMLPANFLRQLIAMYGDSMQGLVPQYLEASMEAFQRNQSQFRDAMTGAFANTFTELSKRNMEMFAEATGGKPGNARAPAPVTRAEPEHTTEKMK